MRGLKGLSGVVASVIDPEDDEVGWSAHDVPLVTG